MALQFIIGRAGSGKSRLLYNQMIDKSCEMTGKNFVAVVPEQYGDVCSPGADGADLGQAGGMGRRFNALSGTLDRGRTAAPDVAGGSGGVGFCGVVLLLFRWVEWK